MTDEITQLLDEARLDEAVERAAALVRGKPRELRPRVLLAELLCFRGELERADQLLDAATTLEPAYAIGLGLFRRLIRAAQAREDLYARGRPPAFPLGEPGPAATRCLEAVVALRASAPAPAGESPGQPCRIDGQPVEDARDADDLLGATLELFLPDGGFTLLALSDVRRLELQPLEKLRDRLWRPGNLLPTQGQPLQVWLPTLYADYPATLAPPPPGEQRDALRLGQATAWREALSGAVLGAGLKTWLAGEAGVTLLELTRIEAPA